MHRGNYTRKLGNWQLFCISFQARLPKNMVSNFIKGGKQLLYSKQNSVLSAAVIIMVMVAVSRILGLVRNRIFVHYFEPERLDTFLAAFQLPDLVFEVLILGAMSSAFIPVFSKYLSHKKEDQAWNVAGLSLNILLLFFFIFSVIIFIFAEPIYSIVARGFSPVQIKETVFFTRYLLAAQFFFVISYLLTAVLETHQRFLISATAPLFYNIGIIATTIILAPSIGLFAPVLGVILGSFLHMLIQLPLALSLGFKPIFSLNLKDPGVQAIYKLALPRLIELSFLQIKRFTDLFTASLVSGGLTYFKFGDSLAALPVGLFGLSIAKAALPKFSLQSGKNLGEFKATFASSFKEILFLVVPTSIFLAVLRLPLVRLAFGASNFDWQDTLDTGYVVSAFSLGAFAYALSLLINRAFYALQDSSTPVKVSILTILINSVLGVVFILGFKLPIWSLALAYSIAGIVQVLVLLSLFEKKVKGLAKYELGTAFTKITIAAGLSGSFMYILLKLLDRAVWDKKLSFLGKLGVALPTSFDRFVLDTSYTVNLITVTFLVALVGGLIYLGMAYLLQIEELKVVYKVLRRLPGGIQIFKFGGKEVVSPPPTNGS